MTLDGYYFAATGISCHNFYRGTDCVCRVSHACLPDEPMRIQAASGVVWTFPPPCSLIPGAMLPFFDAEGRPAASLGLWSEDHFAIATPGTALNGRVVRSHLRKSILYTGLNDDEVMRVEYALDRALAREMFGEWFPRRYVVRLTEDVDEKLLALALAAPFLGIEPIEVG